MGWLRESRLSKASHATKAAEGRWLQRNLLWLFPCSPKTKTFVKSSTHAKEIEIKCAQDGPARGEEQTYYLAPEFKSPEWKAPQTGGEGGGGTQTDVAVVARDSVTSHEGEDWKFNGDESIWPFWAVERLSHEDIAKRRQAEGGARAAWHVGSGCCPAALAVDLGLYATHLEL